MRDSRASSPLRPFGLQFAESCRPPEAIPSLYYDELRDLTMAMLPDVAPLPYVNLASAETQTMTKVVTESPDSDAQRVALSATKTLTAVRNEQTDADVPPHESFLFGTRTETFVVSESSDSDKGASRDAFPTNDPELVPEVLRS